MIKAAPGSSDAFLLAAACHAASRESFPSTILEWNQPIRLGRTLTIGTYELCRTASTEYIFINDCATDRQQYIQDWLKTTNPSSAASSWYKKHKESSEFHLMSIRVDRINLDTALVDTMCYRTKREPPLPLPQQIRAYVNGSGDPGSF
ncbi:hypothetical protein PTKU64_48170 [Paraburkholderia terrae]|uniref:Uncharacterized protein n=1 Tax=Paraburkholderia terrae TaxID=311230 RepID=A0ABN6JJV7_9BURK|nr:hypothetical protein PTKU64_48170 [Paraburkholderia terrae]BDC40394.1 hypothetical protein PTKU15_36910 [Paraburkholderia terrae]